MAAIDDHIGQTHDATDAAKVERENGALLSLPQEIFCLILNYLMPTFRPIMVRYDAGCPHVPGKGLSGYVLPNKETTSIRSSEEKKWFLHHLVLSRVCRKLDDESTRLFYGSNDFQIKGRDLRPMIIFLERLRPATRMHIKSISTRDRLWPERRASEHVDFKQSRTYRPYSQAKHYYQVLPFYHLRNANAPINQICVKFDMFRHGAPVALDQMSCEADWLEPLLEMKRIGLINHLTIDFGVEPPHIKRRSRPFLDDDYQPTESWVGFLDSVSARGIDVRAYRYHYESSTGQ